MISLCRSAIIEWRSTTRYKKRGEALDRQQPENGNTLWANIETRYQLGQEVRGVVTRVAQFGVFVQLEPGIEGVIYAFELGQKPSAVASFSPGQELQLYIKSVDASRKRLELSFFNEPPPGLLENQEVPPTLRLGRKPGASEELLWPTSLPLPVPPLEEQRELNCPGCQRPMSVGWKYCVYCGSSLRRSCPECGTLQPDLADAHYCCECGKQLS